MIRESLTSKQKEVFQNLYIIRSNEEVLPCFGKEQAPLTKENFIAMAIVGKGKIIYLNANDFEYYNASVDDFDFKYSYDKGNYYLKRDSIPEELKKLLDDTIKSREN